MLRSIPIYTMRNPNRNPKVVRIRTASKRNKTSNVNRQIALKQVALLQEEIKDLYKFMNDFDITDYLQELRGKLSYWEGLIGEMLR